TGGAAGAGPTAMITGDTGSFDNSFLITSCAAAGTGFDCPNPAPGVTNCPTTPWMLPGGVATSEGLGSTYDLTFTVAAPDAARIYDVTAHVQGQVEGRTYT